MRSDSKIYTSTDRQIDEPQARDKQIVTKTNTRQKQKETSQRYIQNGRETYSIQTGSEICRQAYRDKPKAERNTDSQRAMQTVRETTRKIHI